MQLSMEEITKDLQVWFKAPDFETFSQKTHNLSLSHLPEANWKGVS